MKEQAFVNDNLIYRVICGSHSYGLDTEDSDIDYKGITIPPKEYYFGLKTFDQQERGADEVIYSLHKFVKLARDANPNIIELLYTDEKFITHMNKYGQKLRDNRDLFLSTKAKHTFSGYAFAQLKRIKNHRKWIMFEAKIPNPEDYMMKKTRKSLQGQTLIYDHFRQHEYEVALKKYNQYLDWKRNRNPERAILEEKCGYDSKHACHLMRLLRMGKEILEKGEVKVLRPDREELLELRNGVWTYEKLIEEAEKAEKELDYLYENSPLQKKPRDKEIDKLLIEITEDFLNKTEAI